MPIRLEGRSPRTRPRVFYGWWVTLAGLVQNYYTSGTFYYGFGAFFNPIIETFGWTRAATSAAFSIQQSESGAIAPFVGLFIDKFGPRRVMLVGTALTGLGFIAISRTTSLVTFYAAMTLLALGLSLGSYVVVATTVSNWFVRKQGLAMAVFSTGAGLAGTIAPILVLLIDAHGWRTTLVWVGVGTWVVGIPVALVLRRRPEDYGQLPDGDAPGGVAQQDVRLGVRGLRWRMPHRPRLAQGEFSAREAMRTRSFWMLAIALTTGFFAMSGVNVHLIPAQTSFGFSRGMAALTVTLLTVLSLGGRWVGGFLADFVDERRILAVGYVIQAIGILVLAMATSYWHVMLFLLLYASGFGATVPTRTVIQARFFGRKSFGTLMGILMTFSTAFSMASPVLVGWMYDIQGSYRMAFMVLAAVCIAAAPLTLLCRRPAPKPAS
ncbi:MAG: MFS transporter [Chloroflexota bacterium]|nr:MFS transporter [Chloroflexota bacterium]